MRLEFELNGISLCPKARAIIEKVPIIEVDEGKQTISICEHMTDSEIEVAKRLKEVDRRWVLECAPNRGFHFTTP